MLWVYALDIQAYQTEQETGETILLLRKQETAKMVHGTMLLQAV